jgi:hypothetical protein
MTDKPKKEKVDDKSGLFIPAGVMLGMGVGFYTNQIAGGLFIGLGLGFLAMALSKAKK